MAFFDQIKSVFDNMNAKQKISMALVLVLSLSAFGALLFWANKPDFQVLYANLNPEDAGTIVSRLKEQRVPYELSAGGTVVSVPAEVVYETRLQLAGQGLPQGAGVGFEIFDKTQLGMTDFVQKMHFQRALQGELTRTILQLAEVGQARVHIALPEKSLFVDQEKKPTASVVLKLKGSAQLSRDQVNGIVHLVASSVEGLSPSAVTVVDIHGKILSAPPNDTAIGRMTTSQLEYQREIEKNLERQAQTMLEAVMGSGRAITRITALLDFSQVEQTEEKYDPDTIAVRSEQRSEEKSGTTGPAAKGVPGVQSNTGGSAGATISTGGGGNSSRTGETINYEVSKTVKHTVLPVGKIQKLTVAVVLDGAYKVAKDAAGKETRQYVALTKTQIDEYQKLVANAVGLDTARGDQLQVTNVPFETGAEVEEAAQAKPALDRTLIMAAVKYGTIALITILLIFFVVKPLIKATAGGAKAARSMPQFKSVEEVEAELRAKMAQEAASPEKVAKEALRKQIVEVAQKNPEDFSGLLKVWMEDTK